MNEKKNAQDRTDAKIRYANIHLDELRGYSRKGSCDDFERSHQESFLYHLFGIRDAFLQELNLYYECGLILSQVSVNNLRKALSNKCVESPEFDEIIKLESNQDSWLNNAKEMRDHSTHRSSVPRVIFVGGQEDGLVHLRNPHSGNVIEEDYIRLFEYWYSEMKKLIERLRKSALSE